MLRAIRITAIALAVFLLNACETQQLLLNVENAGLTAPGNVSMQQVEKAIYRGAADRGWTVRRLAPGLLEAKIQARAHMAVVRITHDARTFSITYKDSRNLQHDGTRIHRNYNRWILNLRKAILRQTPGWSEKGRRSVKAESLTGPSDANGACVRPA